MREVVVPVRQALADIRAGMSDQALMRRYQLSAAGLADLRRQLVEVGMLEQVSGGYRVPATRRILLPQVVAEIRSGISLARLTEKYALSAKGLETLLRQLMAGAHVTQGEIEQIVQRATGSGTFVPLRRYPRYQPPLSLAVLAGSAAAPGWVVDMSVAGLRASGLEVPSAQMLKVVVLGDEFGEFEPFEFLGECRWSATDAYTGPQVGFEIVKICSADFQKLMDTIQSCEPETDEGDLIAP